MSGSRSDALVFFGATVYEYAPGTWGPAEAERKLSPPGGWNGPKVS